MFEGLPDIVVVMQPREPVVWTDYTGLGIAALTALFALFSWFSSRKSAAAAAQSVVVSERSANVAERLKDIEEERRSGEGVRLHFFRPKQNNYYNLVGTLFSSGAAPVKIQRIYVRTDGGKQIEVLDASNTYAHHIQNNPMHAGSFFNLRVPDGAAEILADPSATLVVKCVVPREEFEFPFKDHTE